MYVCVSACLPACLPASASSFYSCAVFSPCLVIVIPHPTPTFTPFLLSAPPPLPPLHTTHRHAVFPRPKKYDSYGYDHVHSVLLWKRVAVVEWWPNQDLTFIFIFFSSSLTFLAREENGGANHPGRMHMSHTQTHTQTHTHIQNTLEYPHSRCLHK